MRLDITVRCYCLFSVTTAANHAIRANRQRLARSHSQEARRKARCREHWARARPRSSRDALAELSRSHAQPRRRWWPPEAREATELEPTAATVSRVDCRRQRPDQGAPVTQTS